MHENGYLQMFLVQRLIQIHSLTWTFPCLSLKCLWHYILLVWKVTQDNQLYSSREEKSIFSLISMLSLSSRSPLLCPSLLYTFHYWKKTIQAGRQMVRWCWNKTVQYNMNYSFHADKKQDFYWKHSFNFSLSLPLFYFLKLIYLLFLRYKIKPLCFLRKSLHCLG